VSSTSTTVIVRPTSDRDVREYHITGRPISDLPYAEFFRPLWGLEQNFGELGPTGEQLVRQLMDESHPEVERVSFRPQSIRISRSPNVAWEQVEEDAVMPALQAALGEQHLTIQKYSDVKLSQLATQGAGYAGAT
jgi:hypothetical protein